MSKTICAVCKKSIVEVHNPLSWPEIKCCSSDCAMKWENEMIFTPHDSYMFTIEREALLRAEKRIRELEGDLRAAQAIIVKAGARVGELEAALKPFANSWNEYTKIQDESPDPDDYSFRDWFEGHVDLDYIFPQYEAAYEALNKDVQS